METTNKDIYNAVHFGVMLIILTLIVMSVDINSKIKNSNKYKVYYEYNVVQGDTIPCDTIYQPLN